MKGHVNKVRNARGREWWNYRTRELERLNRLAPVVVIVINNGNGQAQDVSRSQSPGSDK